MRRLTIERARIPLRNRGAWWVGVHVQEQNWDSHLPRGARQWNVKVQPLPLVRVLVWVTLRPSKGRTP